MSQEQEAENQTPLSREQYAQLVVKTTADMLAIINIEMQGLQNQVQENPGQVDPRDPLEFSLAGLVCASLQMRAKTFLQPPLVVPETELVDQFGGPLNRQGQPIIEGEFREVGLGD